MLNRSHLERFLEVAETRSIQAAAAQTGRSRATYHRALRELEAFFGGPSLMERAPGQRLGHLSAAGEELVLRSKDMLERWDRFEVATKDALAGAQAGARIGALAGSFDLIADLVARADAKARFRLVELGNEELADAVLRGAVDLAFGTDLETATPAQLNFVPLGSLPWVVILPASYERRLSDPVRLIELDDMPLVLHREGPAREQLERAFSSHPQGPLTLQPRVEVASTPRVVDMVARGFGPAVVSRFRAAFLPAGVSVRALRDGPAPFTAGVFSRRGFALSAAAEALVQEAKDRFAEVVTREAKPR